MVWVLPCNFDARHSRSRGSVNIKSTKIINIFNGSSRRSTRCSGGFGFGGFWSMFGMGLGMGLVSNLFSGGFGFGGGTNFFSGRQPAGSVNGNGSGNCNCNCGSTSTGLYSTYTPYIPGQYSLLGASKVTDNNGANGNDPNANTANPNAEAANPNAKAANPNADAANPNTKAADPDDEKDNPNANKKEAGIKNNAYDLNDLKPITDPNKIKEARAKFWKSIGAKENLKGLDSAALPKGFELKQDDAGNIYLVYGGKAYKDNGSKFTLPDENKTDFGNDAYKNQENDDKCEVNTKGQAVNKAMIITSSKTADGATVVTTTQDASKAPNGKIADTEEAVAESYTLMNNLTNHSPESKITVGKNIKAEKIFKQLDLDGNGEITFDEFIAMANGYNADAEHALNNSNYKKGRQDELLQTVDIDSFDTLQLVAIFNKYADGGNSIKLEQFEKLINNINNNTAANLYTDKEIEAQLKEPKEPKE